MCCGSILISDIAKKSFIYKTKKYKKKTTITADFVSHNLYRSLRYLSLLSFIIFKTWTVIRLLLRKYRDWFIHRYRRLTRYYRLPVRRRRLRCTYLLNSVRTPTQEINTFSVHLVDGVVFWRTRYTLYYTHHKNSSLCKLDKSIQIK